MKKLSKLFQWLLDFLPIIGIILFWLLHRILLRVLPFPPFEINSFISSFTQLSGGIITLVIVSKNFSQFRHMNLFSWLKKKLKAFPLRKEEQILEAESGVYVYTSGQFHAIAKKNWNNVDEGLLELERRIDELQTEIKKEDEVLSKEIITVKDNLTSSIIKNSNRIEEIQKLLEMSVLDDIHIQIFGVFLILYGFLVDLLLIQ